MCIYSRTRVRVYVFLKFGLANRNQLFCTANYDHVDTRETDSDDADPSQLLLGTVGRDVSLLQLVGVPLPLVFLFKGVVKFLTSTYMHDESSVHALHRSSMCV